MASPSATGSSSLRSSCSLPNLLVWILNLSLLALAAAALGPVFLLRPRPTAFGWALVSVHAATLLSALAALCAQLTHLCLAAHAALALAAMSGHALAATAFFLRRDRSLALLGSARDRREQLVLAFLEEVLLLGMFLAQAVALAAACVVRRRWAREHQAAEAEKAAVARKRGRKMARVQAESGSRCGGRGEGRRREGDAKQQQRQEGALGQQRWIRRVLEEQGSWTQIKESVIISCVMVQRYDGHYSVARNQSTRVAICSLHRGYYVQLV